MVFWKITDFINKFWHYLTFSDLLRIFYLYKNENWKGFWPNCACSCVVWAWIELSTDDILNVLPLYILDDRDDALKKTQAKLLPILMTKVKSSNFGGIRMTFWPRVCLDGFLFLSMLHTYNKNCLKYSMFLCKAIFSILKKIIHFKFKLEQVIQKLKASISAA